MRYIIYKNNKIINTIIADETFIKSYCAKNNCIYKEDGSEFESIPSQLDMIEAQVTYTAMMTNTLLEE